MEYMILAIALCLVAGFAYLKVLKPWMLKKAQAKQDTDYSSGA